MTSVVHKKHQERRTNTMTNGKLLEEKIQQSGLKKGFIAEKLGVSTTTLTALINNNAEFKASQIVAMCNVLNIHDDAEIKAIFFAQVGA
jgi:plasmid maintenance system antidote protein VapI